MLPGPLPQLKFKGLNRRFRRAANTSLLNGLRCTGVCCCRLPCQPALCSQPAGSSARNAIKHPRRAVLSSLVTFPIAGRSDRIGATTRRILLLFSLLSVVSSPVCADARDKRCHSINVDAAKSPKEPSAHGRVVRVRAQVPYAVRQKTANRPVLRHAALTSYCQLILLEGILFRGTILGEEARSETLFLHWRGLKACR
jgi:hypothetical protein